MQGGLSDQNKKRLLIDLDAFVSPHHFLRRVQEVLNLSFIRLLTSPFYSVGKGRPSIDPEILFRMILLSFFCGIRSDRQLCEHIHYNLLYRWFCLLPLGDKVPDHSSLTRFRDRLGPEVFQQIFEDVLKICRQEGLLKGEEIVIDSTLVHANASLKSFVTTTNKTQRRQRSNLTHKSTTDPDVTLAHKPGSSTSLKYKAHYLVDGASRLILDCFITTGACGDAQCVLERLSYIAGQFDLSLQSVIADRAYGSARLLSSLRQKKITTFIPLFRPQMTKSKPDQRFGFQYDREHDRYICSHGTVLRYISIHKDLKFYQARKKDCLMCPQVAACVPNINNKGAGKRLNRNIHQDLFEAVHTAEQTSLFKAKMTKRFWMIEGLIAEAKTWHRFARAKFRTQPKMQIQAYLTATVQNIKRLVAFLKPLPLLLSLFCSLFLRLTRQNRLFQHAHMIL